MNGTMMTEESINSGGGVPHVRRTTSRTAATAADSGGNHTSVDLLSIESGDTDPSHAGSHTNVTTASSLSSSSQLPSASATTSTTSKSTQHASTASLMQQPPSLRSSLQSHSLFQNHQHSTATLEWYRFYDVRSMDIQSALDQMRTLLSVWNSNTYGNSSKSQTTMIYKLAYYRKQTKNHWYRDDPTFILLQILMLLISCITYSIAFKISVLQAASFILTSILFNYLFLGIVIASILRELTNRHLLTHLHHPQHTPVSTTRSHTASTTTTATSTHIQKQQVEWLYAFDIHCNSFFPLFMVLYVAQFFSMPITLGEGYIPLIVANSLYAIGFCWYWYVTHLGYRALPFLSHTEIFLFPMTIILLFYLFMIIGYPFGFGYNMTRVMARFYFM